VPSRVIDIQSANERPDTLHKFANRVYTSRRSSVESQESNMFDSCDRYDDRFENSEFDCLHMTIGLQTGRHTDRHV